MIQQETDKLFLEGKVVSQPEDFFPSPVIYHTGFVMMGEMHTIANVEKLYDKITGIQYGN